MTLHDTYSPTRSTPLCQKVTRSHISSLPSVQSILAVHWSNPGSSRPQWNRPPLALVPRDQEGTYASYLLRLSVRLASCRWQPRRWEHKRSRISTDCRVGGHFDLRNPRWPRLHSAVQSDTVIGSPGILTTEHPGDLAQAACSR